MDSIAVTNKPKEPGIFALLIFPIIVIGFMSNAIAQATASYGHIA